MSAKTLRKQKRQKVTKPDDLLHLVSHTGDGSAFCGEANTNWGDDIGQNVCRTCFNEYLKRERATTEAFNSALMAANDFYEILSAGSKAVRAAWGEPEVEV